MAVKAKTVELGDNVKDLISGFKGIVVGRTDWLYGCTRFGVQGKMDKEGKVQEAQWFDKPQLVVITKAVMKPQKVPAPDYGPRSTPRLHADPARQGG